MPGSYGLLRKATSGPLHKTIGALHRSPLFSPRGSCAKSHTYLLYDGGLYTFHHEVRKDGFFLNGAPETGSDGLLEYDFNKSPILKVPGDWNTQHESLFYYEGPLWYQRDFSYQPIATRNCKSRSGPILTAAWTPRPSPTPTRKGKPKREYLYRLLRIRSALSS